MAVLNFKRVRINPIFWILFFSVFPLFSAFVYFKLCKIEIIRPPQTKNYGFWVPDYEQKKIALNFESTRSWKLIYLSQQAIDAAQKKQFNNLIKALGKHQDKVLFTHLTYSDLNTLYPDLNLFNFMPETLQKNNLDFNLAFIQDPENRLILGYPLWTVSQSVNQIYDLQTLRTILHDFQKLLKYN